MTEGDPHVIEVDELPKGENSSTFDGHRHGAPDGDGVARVTVGRRVRARWLRRREDR